MTASIQLSSEIFKALLDCSSQRIEFEQNGFRIEIRIIEEIHPFQPNADDLDAQRVEAFSLEKEPVARHEEDKNLSENPLLSTEEQPKTSLETNAGIEGLSKSTVDVDDFLDEEKRQITPFDSQEKSAVLLEGESHPPLSTHDNKAHIEYDLFLDESNDHLSSLSTESNLNKGLASIDQRPSIRLTETSPEPMKLELLDESISNEPDTGDVSHEPNTGDPSQIQGEDNSEDLPTIGKNLGYRLLRTSDTPMVLDMLFHRLAVSPEHSEHLKNIPPREKKSAPQMVFSLGVVDVLCLPVPIVEERGEDPSCRLVGRLSDKKTYVLIYQNEDLRICSAEIPTDGGSLQIALYEGEELLSEDELTTLFQKNARFVGPKEAKEQALQLQKRLGASSSSIDSAKQRKPTMRPASTNRTRGLERSVSIDERFLKRLTFNRVNDEEDLWDNQLQPGVAIFRNNLATLFQDSVPLLEGVLLCLVEQNQYMIFDRRSKRNVPLATNANQRIWLRRIEL